MAERPVPVDELFAKELDMGIPVAALERKEFGYVELDDREKRVVRKVFRSGIEHLKRIAPEIAEDIARQEELAIKAAGIAKATFPVRKNYAFPSVPGSLGVAWLFPQAIKYAATPSSTYPCYTSYKTNTWEIDLTAGTAIYFFGDGTNFYRASSETDKHTFILIFHNGVVEIGSTPKLQQFRLISEGKRDYGAYTVEPLVDIPIEKDLSIYQYPTPLGALMISHERGIMWSAMPIYSGTATIKLLGLSLIHI